MLAVIKTGGKQYIVEKGSQLSIEKIEGDVGSAISFDDVLLYSNDGTVEVGKPIVDGISITGKILEQGRDKKKIVFRYHPKTRYKKKNGHRQNYTKVEITDIKK